MIRKLAVGVALVLAAACASQSRPKLIDPDVAVRLTSGFPPMRAGIDVPLSFDVYLKNRSAEPISIEQVRLESYGMVSYTVRSRTERFRKTVAPGETEKVPLFATARIVSRQAAGAEPLTVRVFITLGTPYGRITRIFMRDAGGTVTGPR